MHRQDVRHGFAQVVKNAPPQPHRAHDRCKVVIQQHQRGGLARHVGTAAPHRHPHMRGLQGRCVVHAIARHGHDLTAGLQRLHDAQFLRRGNAGTHAHRLQARPQFSVTQSCHGVAGQQRFIGGVVSAGQQVRLPGNGAGRGRVITGDHHHPNTGAEALRHGLGNLGAQRVGQAQQTDKLKRKVVLKRGPVFALKARLRHAQHAQALRGHGVHCRGNAVLSLSVQVAQVNNGLGRAFGGHHMGLANHRAPDMRHGAQLGRQAVGLHQGPVVVQVLGVLQKVLAQPVKGLLHGVKRVGHAGQNGEFHQRVKDLRQLSAGGVVNAQLLARLSGIA